MHPAIHVENLSKKYRLGETHSRSLGELVHSAAARLWGRKNGHTPAAIPVGDLGRMDSENNFWALRDLTFEVQTGDVVGIIGSNGAGKSTLLKVLSRITSPTSGTVRVYGRIASLLEVGTGFHPELTGRENVFLNGAILGMTRTEIQRRFDEIIAFAEIDQFIDTPVKRYSSGMYVRLAFAVAAHLEPEILIIDEVLSVGDVAFQRKCLGKMSDVAKHGRTVLFVSHNMQAVMNLCRNVVWMQNGRLRAIGDSRTTVENYLRDTTVGAVAADINEQIEQLPADPNCRFRYVALEQGGAPTRTVLSGSPVDVVIHFSVFKRTPGLHVYVQLLDAEGTLLFETLNNGDSEELPVATAGNYYSHMRIPANFLSSRNYIACINAGIANVRLLLPEPLRIPFDVQGSGLVNRAYPGYMSPGKLAPLLEWTTEVVPQDKSALSALHKVTS